MEICQYILINMVSQNLPHRNLSIHINKYGIPFIYHMEINKYGIPEFTTHINKYGIPLFTTWKFVNTY